MSDDGWVYVCICFVRGVYWSSWQVAYSIKWLLVDGIGVWLVAPLLRLICGVRRWEALIRQWKRCAPPQPHPTSLPNLLVYAALLLFWLCLALQVAAMTIDWEWSSRTPPAVRFAYTSPPSSFSGPHSVHTAVNVTQFHFLINQTDAANRSHTLCSAAASNIPSTTLTPLPCGHHQQLPTHIRAALSLPVIVILLSLLFGLLSSLLMVCKLYDQVSLGAVLPCGKPSRVVKLSVAPCVLSLSPGLLLLAAHCHLASHYELNAVGAEATRLYWASAVGAASWTLAVLSWCCARGERFDNEGNDEMSKMELITQL